MVTKVVTKVKRPQQGGLTPHFVRTVTRPGRYGDGHGGFGLSLYVKPAAKGRISKSWNQRLPIEARKREKGLGAYPAIHLHLKPGEKALDNWQRVKAGEDILATKAASIPTPIVSEGLRRKYMANAPPRVENQNHRDHLAPLPAHTAEPILTKPVSEVTDCRR